MSSRRKERHERQTQSDLTESATSLASRLRWFPHFVIPIFLASILYYTIVWYPHELSSDSVEQGSGSWKIVNVGGDRGLGMVATRDISQGELVLRQVREEVGDITQDRHHITYQARLNHGCGGTANVAYHWRLPPSPSSPSGASPTEGDSSQDDLSMDQQKVQHPELRIYALKDIKRGQELLASYIDSRRTKEDRHAKILSDYNFTCTCKLCALPDDSDEARKHNERLKAMAETYKKFEGWVEGRLSGPEAIQAAREVWRLSGEEGYFLDRGRLAQEAAYIAAAHADEKATIEWLTLAYEWLKIEKGDDHEMTQQARRILLNGASTHFAWGFGERIDVGGPNLDD